MVSSVLIEPTFGVTLPTTKMSALMFCRNSARICWKSWLVKLSISAYISAADLLFGSSTEKRSILIKQFNICLRHYRLTIASVKIKLPHIFTYMYQYASVIKKSLYYNVYPNFYINYHIDKYWDSYLTSSEGLMMALKRSLFTLFLIKGNNSSSQEYSNTAFRSKSNSSCYWKQIMNQTFLLSITRSIRIFQNIESR